MRQIIKIFLPFLLLSIVVQSEKLDTRLIKTEFSTELMTDSQIQKLVQKNIKFMDITFGGELKTSSVPLPARLPNRLSKTRESEIRNINKNIRTEKIKENLKKLTSFKTRYYKSSTGRAASEWVFRKIKGIIKNSKMKVNVQRIFHRGWPQYSVRCRIKPDNSESSKERVLLTAHLDSTSLFAPMYIPAPGADDDGSGVVTLLEVLRILSENPTKISRPIEFVFFSAEEAGLLGSQAIARYYQQQGLSAAMLHIDMDGYVADKRNPGIGLIMDNTDSKVNQLLISLIHKYTKLPVKKTQCGYACSDHYSFHIAGFPAAALFEGSFEEQSPHIHRPSDTVETIDFDHIKEFVKIATAFLLHMTDPKVDYT